MAENLFCAERECGQLASVFGIVSGKKVRACNLHIQNLMQKATTVHDIAAYAFIDTPKDGPIYEERRCFTEQGLGNLNLLEAECDRGWEDGKKTLFETFTAMNVVMQKSFQEMHLKAQKCYENMKQDLGEIRRHLKLFAHDRHFQLSPGERTLCESAPTGPVFDVTLGDCRMLLAENLLRNVHVAAWDVKVEKERDWRRKLQKSLSNKAAVFQKNEETSQGLRSLIATPAEREAIECLKAGNTARNNQDYERALDELQRGRDLLKTTRDIDLYLELNNSLVETCCLTERWEDVVFLSQQILEAEAFFLQILGTWGRTSHHCELLRTLFYLTQAHYQLDQEAQGYAVVEKWAEKLKVDSPRSRCVLLCIQSITLRQQGDVEKAAELYKTAAALDQSFPYILASSRCSLANVSQPQSNQQMVPPVKRSCTRFCCFPIALLIISLLIAGRNRLYPETTSFTPSEDYANSLLLKGVNLYEVDMLWDAELAYLQAIEIYSVHFSESQNYADCLCHLGFLYEDMGNLEDSEKRYLQGINIYSNLYPQSQNYANCLKNLGMLYRAMRNHENSEKRYIQAITIYSTLYSQIQNYADCLYHLGQLYLKDGRKIDAMGKFEKASQTYQLLDNQAYVIHCNSALKTLSS